MTDLVIVVCKTDPDAGAHGFSLIVVERDTPGFERGRNLEKIGMSAQDTAELSFTDVRVPAANLLGEEGKGFIYLMQNLPRERLSIAVGSIAGAEKVARGDDPLRQGAHGVRQAARETPDGPLLGGRDGHRSSPSPAPSSTAASPS